MQTIHDIEVTATVPAGTRVSIVEDPMGLAYAVDDVQLLIRLSGNSHDPHYRHVYVPASSVGTTNNAHDELVAALREAARLAQIFGHAAHPNVVANDFLRILDHCRAALAKAESDV